MNVFYTRIEQVNIMIQSVGTKKTVRNYGLHLSKILFFVIFIRKSRPMFLFKHVGTFIFFLHQLTATGAEGEFCVQGQPCSKL